MICSIRPTSDRVDDVRRVTTCSERSSHNVGEEDRRPCRVLRVLNNNSIAREDTRDHGSNEVVEGIVPADTGGNDTQRLITDLIRLVEHKKVGRS